MSRPRKPIPDARASRPSGVLGMTVGDRWYISEPLATGGMGTIFLGVDIQTGIEVAIKVMRGELAQSDEALARFGREIRAVATLNSPHIVAAYDAGTVDGMPYMVMERLRGRDLDELAASGEITPRQAIIIVIDLLEGLSHAHAAGIIHRDLKPSNVWLTDDNCVKILDFGVAKIHGAARTAGDETGKITGSGAVLGSPAYMSPEQLVRSKSADERADLWSVGAVLYELFTGSMLFKDETVGGIFAKVLHMPIPPLREALPGASPELERIIARCLERDPTQRFASAKALAEELRLVLDDDIRGDSPLVQDDVMGRPTTARAGQEGADSDSLSFAPTLALPHTDAPEDRPAADKSSRRWLAGIALVAIAATLTLVAIVRTGPAAEPSATASAETAGTTTAQALDGSAREVKDTSLAVSTAQSAPSAPSSQAAQPATPSATHPSPQSPAAMPRPPTPAKSPSAKAPPEDELWETSRH